MKMEVAVKILLWIGLSLIATVEPQLSDVAQKLMEAINDPTRFCFFEILKLGSDTDLAERLINFWHPDLPVTEDMGCVIRCGMQRIDLLDSEDRINQDNMRDLLIANGADIDSATKYIKMMADCRHQAKSVGCEMAAILADCVRFHLYSWNWLPPYQEWVTGEDDNTPSIG